MLRLSLSLILRSRRLVAILILGFVAISPPAKAQVLSPGGTASAFVPDILQRDATLFIGGLSLDGTQQVVFESLLEDYQTEFRRGSEAVRAQLAEIQPDPEESAEARRLLQEEAREELKALWEEMRRRRAELPEDEADERIVELYRKRSEEIREKLDAARDPYAGNERLQEIMAAQGRRLEEWNAERHRLYTEFMENVQLLLTEEQTDLWPAFERRFRREKTLSQGELSGESVNLFHVLRDIDLPEAVEEMIVEPLASYELNLDIALRQRDAYLRDVQAALSGASGDRRTVLVENLLDRVVALRIAVRDVNDASTEAIAAALPDDVSSRFLDEARQRAYPRVYRATGAQALLSAATELVGLDREATEAIAELERQYRSELSSRNEQLRLTLRQHEPESFKRRAMRLMMPVAGRPSGGGEDPIGHEFRLRNEWSQEYITRLEGLLSPELVEELRRIRMDFGRPRAAEPPRGAGRDHK